jgi:hypothetical protein
VAPESDELTAIARRYERFATVEARGASALYEQLALAIAGSPELLTFLCSLPPERRQRNLFLAAVRHVGGLPHDASALEEIVRTHAFRVKQVMSLRMIQTNEPARCAVLLPVLASLDQPLALLEIGASAGLCLLPDCYGYDYGSRRIEPAWSQPAGAPIFRCAASATTPVPHALPMVGWRLGLDLNPLDVTSPTDMEWLETLVWPGQEQRACNLRAAHRDSRVATHRRSGAAVGWVRQ